MDYGCFAPVQAFLEVFREAGIEPEIDEVREPMGMLKREHIHTMLHMPRIRNLWREKYGREPRGRIRMLCTPVSSRLCLRSWTASLT